MRNAQQIIVGTIKASGAKEQIFEVFVMEGNFTLQQAEGPPGLTHTSISDVR